MEILSFTWLVYLVSVLAISCFFLDLVIHKSSIGLHIYTMVTDRDGMAFVRLVLSRFSGVMDRLLGEKLISKRAFWRVLPVSIILNVVIVTAAIFYISQLPTTTPTQPASVATVPAASPAPINYWQAFAALIMLIVPFFIYAFFDFFSVCVTRRLIRLALVSGKMLPSLVLDTLLSAVLLWFQAFFSFIAVVGFMAAVMSMFVEPPENGSPINMDILKMSYQAPYYAIVGGEAAEQLGAKYVVGGLALFGASNMVLTIVYWIFAVMAFSCQLIFKPFAKSTQLMFEKAEQLPRSFFSSVGTLLGAFIVYS